jgi:hypothetical protein
MHKIIRGFIAGMVGVIVTALGIAVYAKRGYFVQNVQDNGLLLAAGFIVAVIIWFVYFQVYFTEVDIHSRGKWPANVLSNFHDNPFYFDGIYCASFEGILQAFKTKFVNEQARLCGLSGRAAQKAGQEYNNWKESQYLYWNGESYERGSAEYWELLLRVFDIENMNIDKITALLATGNRKLVYSIGKKDKPQTVLTEDEFCRLLTIARVRLKEKGLVYIG